MEIKDASSIDGSVAKALRMELSLSQSKFWGRVGVHQCCGSQYESGKRRIPRPVQQLLFITYLGEGRTFSPDAA